MSQKTDKEIRQELGITEIVPGLDGIYIEDMLIPIYHGNERIKRKDYEESFEVYKERRKVMKKMQKDYRKGHPFWNSAQMGQYRKMTEEEVHEKYKDFVDEKSIDEVADELMKMDKEMRKEKQSPQEESEILAEAKKRVSNKRKQKENE